MGNDPADAVASYQEIAALLALHSRGIDRCRPALVQRAYHDDAAVAYGMFNGAAHEFATVVTGAIQDLPVTAHRINQSWIDISGDGAKAETLVVAYMDLPGPDSGTQLLIGGRYLDRFTRRDGQWRMAHRTYVLDWNINRPIDNARRPAPARIKGGHGDEDAAAAIVEPGPAHAQKGAPTMSAPILSRLDAALSRQDLERLNAAYARAVDRADRPLFDSLWQPDATVATDFFSGPATGYGDAVFPMLAGLQRTSHAVSNQWFEIDGDRAVGESYVFAVVTTQGEGPRDILTGGRYLDRFERRDGIWKFSHRTFVTDWVIEQDSTAIFGQGVYEALSLRGGRAPHDPVYDFWAAR